MKHSHPVAKETSTGRFTPADFAEVLLQVPEGCPVVGGQAVAWWATKYGISVGARIEPITSGDIDFWGSRDDLKELAKRLRCKPIFPHEYEMTVWAGAIPFSIKGEKTIIEFLHTIPGLDTNDPNRASVEQEYIVASGKRILQFLSPVSLVLAKLHGLRHFDQKEREDELHLRAALRASAEFILQLLHQKAVREALWNCERLLEAHQLKPYARLAAEHAFNVLEGVPIEGIRKSSNDSNLEESDRKRLANFCKMRWSQVIMAARQS